MDKILLAAKYVEGDLNEWEYQEFERTIECDRELQEYLSYYKEVNQSVTRQLKEALSYPKIRRYRSMSEGYEAEELTYKLDYLWYAVWIAALVIGLWVWRPWQTTLYEKFSLDKDYVTSVLVRAPYYGFEKAAQFLEKKDYYQTKLIVSKSYVKDPDNAELAYYYAMVLMADGRAETSEKVLMPVAKGNSLYKDNAIYMLALTYLKRENTKSCREWLLKLPKRSAYYEQSRALLANLG